MFFCSQHARGADKNFVQMEEMVLNYIYEKVTCQFGAAGIIATCKRLQNLCQLVLLKVCF